MVECPSDRVKTIRNWRNSCKTTTGSAPSSQSVVGRSDDPPGALVADGPVRSKGETDRPFLKGKVAVVVHNSLSSPAALLGSSDDVDLDVPLSDPALPQARVGCVRDRGRISQPTHVLVPATGGVSRGLLVRPGPGGI